MELKVLTLNCWGVFTPPCKDRFLRIDAIAKELSKGSFDIIVLQEVWTQHDYKKIKNRLKDVFSFSHYFHSGIFGCGVCIFTKHIILDTFHHQYSLNGYAHHFYHGDWFCGKSICLAKLQIDDFMVNVYCSHLHAQYKDDPQDEYKSHRLLQAYEASQFIKLTSDCCDFVIVAGDFNLTETSLGYRLLKTNANLNDAWLTQESACDDKFSGSTCDRPDNPYRDTTFQKSYPNGQRIDYLFFRNNSGNSIRCKKCSLTLGKIPDSNLFYSDHIGVSSLFELKRDITNSGKPRLHSELEKCLSESITIFDEGISTVTSHIAKKSVILFLSFVFLLLLSNILSDMFYMRVFSEIVFLSVFFYSLLSIIVLSSFEHNALLSTKKNIANLLRSLNLAGTRKFTIS